MMLPSAFPWTVVVTYPGVSGSPQAAIPRLTSAPIPQFSVPSRHNKDLQFIRWTPNSLSSLRIWTHWFLRPSHLSFPPPTGWVFPQKVNPTPDPTSVDGVSILVGARPKPCSHPAPRDLESNHLPHFHGHPSGLANFSSVPDYCTFLLPRPQSWFSTQNFLEDLFLMIQITSLFCSKSSVAPQTLRTKAQMLSQ